MFDIKSPLKYFPIEIGDFSLVHKESTNSFNLVGKDRGWMGYDYKTHWQANEFYVEIDRAYGVCVTTGLGLGILQCQLCLKENVEKVVVYEKSADVIEIFYKIVEFNNFDTSKNYNKKSRRK